MECYYHSGKQACGICKSCQRGLCVECAAEVSNGIACLNRCEQEAIELDQIVKSSKRTIAKSETLIQGVGLGSGELFNIVLGVLFSGFGLYKGNEFLSYLGGAFLVFGLWGIIRVLKAKHDNRA